MKLNSGMAGRRSLLVNDETVKLFLEHLPEDANVLQLGWAGELLLQEVLSKPVNVTVVDSVLPDYAKSTLETAENITHHIADPVESLDKTLKREKPEWVLGVLSPLFSEFVLKRLAYWHFSGGLLLVCRREHVDALLAGPYGRMYGWLSVMMRHHYNTERLMNIDKDDFSPPLTWQSAVLLKTHDRRPLCDLRALDVTLKYAFRKHHERVGLRFANQLSKTDWMELVIDPDSRPERLHYHQWAALAQRLYPDEGLIPRGS